MKIRSLCLCLLALCLCFSLAAAETTVTEYRPESRSVQLNAESSTLIVRVDGGYQIIDPQGNPLSEVYGDIRVEGPCFTVGNENTVNCWGLIDGQGKPVMPMQYGDVKAISDRWAAGIVLTEATAENYDYTTLFSSEKAYFLVDTVDIYYQGNKVGSLDRMQWNSADAYGDYLHVRTRDSGHLFFNKEMQPASREAERSSEYDDDYKTKTVWHQGSGQAAFTEGCTLTPEEVLQSVMEVDGQLKALDGTVLADLSAYDTVYSIVGAADYIKVRGTNDKFGLLDLTGKEVAPCEYDEFDYSLDHVRAIGWVYAEKDGKGGYINLATGEETGFLYSKDVTQNYACYMKATDLDGSIIVISAAAGRLDASFKDVRMDYSSGSTGNRMFVGQGTDDTCGVYGLYGEAVIPASENYNSVYDFEISRDGTVILAHGDDGYIVCTVAYDPAPAGN